VGDLKKRDLIKKLENNGWWLERHGSKHDIYTNETKNEPIPRNKEIDEILAKAIIRRQGLK
jgi:mRNA interferase HicA